jgi:hypothetical protein
MHLQGMFSGKVEGDLDSVPGYYGGTASYKWVQNAKALNHLRVARHYKTPETGPPPSTDRILHGLSPSASRIKAYEEAKARHARPTVKSEARGLKYKFANEHGAQRAPKLVAPKVPKKPSGTWEIDANGNRVYKPPKPVAV